MRYFRFTIAGLMGAVLFAAVGLAALKNASETWASAMLLLTCGILGLAVVGVFCGSRAGRPGWLGFCVFGGTYMVLSRCWSSSDLPWLPTTDLLKRLVPPTGGALRKVVNPFCGNTNFIRDELSPEQIGQCLWTLLAALLGALLARLFFADPSGPFEGRESDSKPMAQPSRDRWIRPMIAVMVILIPLTSIATIGSRSNAVFWTSTTLFLTCGLIGLAVLGAVFRRGRYRAIWLGAALFGGGCLVPVLARPANSPFLSDQLLNGFRPWLPRMARSINHANARILEALERPIPMRFPDEIPLGDLLKHIGKLTSTRTAPGIPIYVDPIGLQEAERSLDSTVQIDLESVPLKTTLRLGLTQLGLDYTIDGGCLRIISEDQATAPGMEDPFLIIGHCLLALVAAGFGAMLAPVIADARREPSMRALDADRRPL